VPNCLHPEVIELWQAKGYTYRPGFCRSSTCCEREANPARCPFLRSIDELKEADTIVVTKALAQRERFFSTTGNPQRDTVVIDEDPVGLLRPPVTISRNDLQSYLQLIGRIERHFAEVDNQAARQEAAYYGRVAQWCWDQIARQPAQGEPEAVPVPLSLHRSQAVLSRSKRARKAGRSELTRVFFRLMRKDPVKTVRNVGRDLHDLVKRSAGQALYATATQVFFHLQVTIPQKKRIIVLDATGNPEVLRPLFAPRPLRVVCNERVEPAGRIIQFMDNNGPRSYLNRLPGKLTRIIDALGDLHPRGTIVLISHKSCVDKLRDSSKHRERIVTAYFGAVRGRNDLEPAPGRLIACHIVAGSPKTPEPDRQQLALAVFGKEIMPFPELQTMRKSMVGFVPEELSEGDGAERIWEVRVKAYADPRMQAVYEHTVTAELTHAADRARVLVHQEAVVYLVTNEPGPRLWFSEMCFADELLDLSNNKRRADFEAAYGEYEAKARELLDAGKAIRNADVCRAMNKNPGGGKRYWQRFFDEHKDALEGRRKVRWKEC
jgi:hypothetical protein